MNRILQQVANQYWFRVSLTVICCLATICLDVHQSYVWFSVSACLLILSIIWQVRLYLPAHQAGALHDRCVGE